MPAEDYSELLEFYNLKETIGSGGFAKVKLGVHLLTKEKVAVKIVDKQSVGKDLPRVLQEIEALKNLVHHNVARLIQIFNTTNKLFIILEYCGGGELFDYIVNRDRLEEREGRQFFRQILAAVGYIHSKGYCHRDLKPENILLDTENNIKLIDFGLCACPSGGLGVTLETCCGSPAYAAPELVSGQTYYGAEADIWSLGVLLYALLCGFLPFEDNNVSKLYRKIQAGVFETPTWLSESAVKVIKRCLTVDRKQRVTIDELMRDPWVVEGYSRPIIFWSTFSKYEFDESVVGQMAEFLNASRRDIKVNLSDWKYEGLVAIYQVLLLKKNRGESLEGVLQKVRSVSNRNPAGVPRSPSCSVQMSSAAVTLESSSLIDDVFEPVTPSTDAFTHLVTPTKNNFKILVDRTPIFNNSVHASLRKNPKLASFKVGASQKDALASMTVTPVSKNMAKPIFEKNVIGNHAPSRTHSCDVLDTPGRIREFGSLRKPSSRLASIEDNIDKLVDLLTPKKRASLTSGPRHTRCFVENCTSAGVLLHEVHRCCREGNFESKLKTYTVSCKARDANNKVILKFSLEIVVVSKYKQLGILRKRLSGDTWHYKAVTQSILNAIDLS